RSRVGGVLVRRFRVVVQQQPGGNEVLRDLLGEGLREAAKLGFGCAVELGEGQVRGQLGLTETRPTRIVLAWRPARSAVTRITAGSALGRWHPRLLVIGGPRND